MMSSFKEQWFREFERQLSNGVSYDRAGDAAYKRAKETYYSSLDRADAARKREKEEPREP